MQVGNRGVRLLQASDKATTLYTILDEQFVGFEELLIILGEKETGSTEGYMRNLLADFQWTSIGQSHIKPDIDCVIFEVSDSSTSKMTRTFSRTRVETRLRATTG